MTFEGKTYSFRWDLCDAEVAALLEKATSLEEPRATVSVSPSIFSPTETRSKVAARQARLLGGVIGIILGLLLAAIVGALVVRFATEFVAGFVPPYGMAFKAAFLGSLAAFLLGVTFLFVAVGLENEMNAIGYVALAGIGFIAYSAALTLLIKHPETGRIGFGQASAISLAQTLAVALLVFVVFALVWVAIT